MHPYPVPQPLRFLLDDGAEWVALIGPSITPGYFQRGAMQGLHE